MFFLILSYSNFGKFFQFNFSVSVLLFPNSSHWLYLKYGDKVRPPPPSLDKETLIRQYGKRLEGWKGSEFLPLSFFLCGGWHGKIWHGQCPPTTHNRSKQVMSHFSCMGNGHVKFMGISEAVLSGGKEGLELELLFYGRR